MSEALHTAADCNFATGKVGDTLLLQNPLWTDDLVEARLSKVTGPENLRVHTYELYMFGVWFGTALAFEHAGGASWKVLT